MKIERIKSEKTFYEKFYAQDNFDVNKDYPLIEKVSFGIKQLGRSEGRKIMDICCGVGITSSHLAREGWNTYCVDVSLSALKTARQLAKAKGVSARMKYVVAAAEYLPFKDNIFDSVFCNAGLHHTELSLSVKELSRVLKSGSMGVFIETSALNPVLMFARKYLTGRFGIPRKRTQSELPLGRKDIKLIKNYFKKVEIIKTFHFLSQTGGYLFKSGTFIDRLFFKLDKILLSIPPFRKAGYWLVIKVIK